MKRIVVKTQFELDSGYLLERALELQRALRQSKVYLGSDYKLYEKNSYLVNKAIKEALCV